MVTSDITAVISDPGVKIRWSMCENWRIKCDTDKTKDILGPYPIIKLLQVRTRARGLSVPAGAGVAPQAEK